MSILGYMHGKMKTGVTTSSDNPQKPETKNQVTRRAGPKKRLEIFRGGDTCYYIEAVPSGTTSRISHPLAPPPRWNPEHHSSVSVHCYHYLISPEVWKKTSFFWYFLIGDIVGRRNPRIIPIEITRLGTASNKPRILTQPGITEHQPPRKTFLESKASEHLKKIESSLLPTIDQYIKELITQSYPHSKGSEHSVCECQLCGQKYNGTLLFHLLDGCSQFHFQCINCATAFLNLTDYLTHLDGKEHTITPTTKSYHNSEGNQHRVWSHSLSDGLEQESIDLEDSEPDDISDQDTTPDSTGTFPFVNHYSHYPTHVKVVQKGVAPSGSNTTNKRRKLAAAAEIEKLKLEIKDLKSGERS